MAARGPRSLARRIVRWLGILLVTVIALAGLLLCFLQTRWGREVVRARIEAKLDARVNGTVSVGSVEYSWLFREIELRDVVVLDVAGQRAAAVGSLRATIDRTSVIDKAPVIEDLVVEGLDVVTARLEDIAKPSTSGSSLASFAIERLRIAGSITVERPDGTKLSVRDLALTGSVHGRPAASVVELALRDVSATAVTLARPGETPREVAVTIASINLTKSAAGVDVAIGLVKAGPVTISKVAGKLAGGGQAIAIAGLHVENTQLAALFGRDLLKDDASADLSITGPLDKLVIDGDVRSGPAHVKLDGTLDVSNPAVPKYDLVLVGTALQSDVVTLPKNRVPPVATSLRARIVGSGVTRADVDAKLSVQVGATTIGELVVDGIALEASADHGALRVDRLHASGPGMSFDGSGVLGADRVFDGKIAVRATPPALVATLAKYGVVVPPRAPLPPTLDVAVTAHGPIDGAIAINIEPTKLPLAGGRIDISGRASIEHRRLASATVDVRLRGLDLAAVARLAGTRPKAAGSLSGSLVLNKTGPARSARYDLAVALPALGLDVSVRGSAKASRTVAQLSATRAGDGKVVATGSMDVPLTRRRGKPALDPTSRMAVKLDVARQSIAELLPPKFRAKLPATGDVELHVDLRGTAARPTGRIDLTASGEVIKGETQRLTLRGDVTSSAGKTVVATRGSAWLRDEPAPIATLDGRITTAALIRGGTLDVKALRAATVNATIVLPPRELASFAWLRAELGKPGGTVDGRVVVTGPLTAPHVAAAVTVRDMPTADGEAHDITVTADGTTKVLTATLSHGTAVKLVAQVDRSAPGRIAIEARANATKAPLRTLIPAFLAARLGPHTPGLLDWDMTGNVVLVEGPTGLSIDRLAVAGTLDVSGGEILVPNSKRRWHGIELSVASEPTGLRLNSLELHESDRQVTDRVVRATGFMAWDRFKPQTIKLALTAKDWLISGSKSLGKHDAPRATLDADLALDADLRGPVIEVDATVNALAFNVPERFDRAHQYENVALGGDIFYTDGGVGAGKLPYVPPAAPSTRKLKPIDIRIHVPRPIRVQQPPLEAEATGEIAVNIRNEGITARGTLTLTDGKVEVIGHRYHLVKGSLAFTDEHPTGWVDITFEHTLPAPIDRNLSVLSAGGGARVSLQGGLAHPKRILGGANNAALMEAMSINTVGHPHVTSAPDLPASATVNLSRMDPLQILSFMAQNLPHLLVLDRITAYADPYRDRAAYGRIENVEAERYAKDQRSRVRAVVRPPTPGRSSAELQYDRLFINDGNTAAGVGIRGGDRAGGGVGVFLEWSSSD